MLVYKKYIYSLYNLETVDISQMTHPVEVALFFKNFVLFRGLTSETSVYKKNNIKDH